MRMIFNMMFATYMYYNTETQGVFQCFTLYTMYFQIGEYIDTS